MPEIQSACSFQDHAVLIAAGKVEFEKCKRPLQSEGWRKCKHGVFCPSKEDPSRNPMCSICRTGDTDLNFLPGEPSPAAILKLHPEVADAVFVEEVSSEDDESEEDGDDDDDDDPENEEIEISEGTDEEFEE